MSFKQYLLTEKVFQQHSYIFSPLSLYDFLKRNPSGGGDELVDVSPEDRYSGYKKRLSTSDGVMHSNDYIFQILNVNYFDPMNNQDMVIFLKQNNQTYEQYVKYFGQPSKYNFFPLVAHGDDWLLAPHFQGVIDNKNPVFKDKKISLKWMKANKDKIHVIDGNAKRFGNLDVAKSEVELPDFVIKELVRYSDDAGKKISPNVVEWLKKNYPKPYTEIKVFRGVGTLLGHSGTWNLEDVKDVDVINKNLKKYFGVSDMKELHKGGMVYLSRGKESSWSRIPQVSNAFAAGMASKYIDLLVYTTVNAENVIFDFNTAPVKYRSEFKYIHQNEVIIDKGRIPSVISQVRVDEKFLALIRTFGYDYKPGLGIVKGK